MEIVKDKIVDFNSETKTSKAGKPYTVHNIVFAEFGPVSLGFTKPETLPFAKNDVVAIEVEKKFGQWQFTRQVGIDEDATMTTPPATHTGGSGWKGGSGGGKFAPKVFPVPADHGDMAIIHQNSLTNAIKLLELRSGEGVGVDTSTEAVINLAYELAAFSSGAHLAKLAKD